MADGSKNRSADFLAETQGAAGSNRHGMECVLLPPRPGAEVSNRPPVEIFLGTEPAQYRANRVFGWSIEKVRDPGRAIRIHLMSELTGFDRRGWTTGFTNFRFAIPALLGGRGRAIYNDEDQIYLTDPGELFDLDLGPAAYLSISDTESSVMLIDCERMAPVWTLNDAQHAWKRTLLRKASGDTGLRGDLDPGWNARDEEFEPGRSQLLHYTTLHTQPWRPFSGAFRVPEGGRTRNCGMNSNARRLRRGLNSLRLRPLAVASRNASQHCSGLPLSEMGSGIENLGRSCWGPSKNSPERRKRGTLLEVQPDLRGDDETRAPAASGWIMSGVLGCSSASRDSIKRSASMACSASRVWKTCLSGDIPWLIESLFSTRARRFVFAAVRTPLAAPRRRFFAASPGHDAHERVVAVSF